MAISYNHTKTLSGTTPSQIITEGNWAYLTASGNTTLTLTSNSGDAGLLFFDNGAANNFTLTINGTTVSVNPTGVTMIGWVNLNGTLYFSTNYIAASGSNGALTEYTGNSVPSAPATGATAFARKRTARHFLAQIGSNSVVRELQDAWYNAHVTVIAGNNSTNALVTNNATVSNGTPVALTPSTGNYLTSFMRCTFSTATTAGSSNFVRIGNGYLSRKWGFLVVLRFAVAPGAQTRFFAGMTTAAAFANAETSSNTNLFGYGCDAAEANLSLINNDGAGTAAKTSLGATYPVSTAAGEVIEVRIGCKPGDTKVYLSLERLTGAQTSTNLIEHTLDSASAELPADTTMLVPHIWINNGTGTTADTFTFIQMYIYKP